MVGPVSNTNPSFYKESDDPLKPFKDGVENIIGLLHPLKEIDILKDKELVYNTLDEVKKEIVKLLNDVSHLPITLDKSENIKMTLHSAARTIGTVEQTLDFVTLPSLAKTMIPTILAPLEALQAYLSQK